MMGKLLEQLKAVLPEKLWVPDELAQLYQWIEQQGYYEDYDDGHRTGFLYPDDKLEESWKDDERQGGTIILFNANRNDGLRYWFGLEEDTPEICQRLCVFARTGAEGSEAALWLDDNGELKIVHMGSGSGSILSCVLAENMVDFLRLQAIGYDEICWNEEFPYPPNHQQAGNSMYIHPNVEFQQWVQTTFNTTIPTTALEIVKHPSEMGERDSEDAFCRWAEKQSN
ncbi:SMI1/KNR4 family protein [Budviciaceae bacterium BWR-B9]|uniref:SMI1/KNR4 family protein n=2 Tax=Budviciaceae TaxID=1903416 RepID=A0ABS1IQ77_9GAMM|nr:SMI1/KNR4 family protein [Limnobaculum allomyrinae]